MQKILLTCFLVPIAIGTCLFGSSMELRKVAQSPPEPPLHRSAVPVSPHSGDPHRGEETLSDTFTQEDSKAYLSSPVLYTTSLSNLDGGPVLRTSLPSPVVRAVDASDTRQRTSDIKLNFGLVDNDQDNEEGKEASNFHSSSVPVFSNQINSGREALSQSTEAQSLASCVLDLASRKPAVIYVETLSLFPIDSLEFRVWNPYLNELEAPKPVTEILPLSLGTVFEGSWGTKNVQYVTPPLTEFARLTIRNDRFKYLDRFLIQPGDSVRIRLDFQTATVLFSGPSAEKFQAQYELAKAIASERFAKNPIMFTGKSNYWGHSVDDSLRILQAKTTASAIRPAIQFVSPDSSGLRYLEAGFSEDLNTHSAWKILEMYQDKLPDEFWQILKADVQGWLQYDQIKHFLYLRLGLENNPKYQQLYREHILQDKFPLPQGAEWSVYYIDYLFQKLTTISYMEKKSMVSLIPSLPREVRDPVYAKFLIKNFRNFEDSNLQFEQALAIIETPWIKGVIDTLYHAQRIGAPLAEIPLVNTKGDAVILQGGDGKIRFIQFWLPGCQASASYYAKLLAPVVEHYKDDPEVEFVFISNDSDHNRWLENISAETYSDKEALNLNAPGRYHPYLKYYHMYAFPEQMVVDRAGGVVNLGNVPKTPEGLIQYLDSLKNSPYSTNQPNAK